MNIFYKDDKKEKWQSHEFHGRVDSMSAYASISISIDGYGSDKEESATDFMNRAGEMITELQNIINKLEHIDKQTLLGIQEADSV